MKYLCPEQEKDKTNFTDKETGLELEQMEANPLLEWFANNYNHNSHTTFGAALEIITDRSPEGAQFVKNFGGIGGILRYELKFQPLQAVEECRGDLDNFDLDDY